MKIKITKQNCSKGVRGSCRDCPVALGFNDALDLLGTGLAAKVGARHVNFFRKGYCRESSCLLPSNVTARIYHYDLTGEMKPFEFEFQPVSITSA